MNLWGSSQIDFTTFKSSFISILLMTLGKINVNELVAIDYYWSLIFLSFFYFVIIFFLLSVFLGIVIDSYRLVVMDQGYSLNKENSWKLSGIFSY